MEVQTTHRLLQNQGPGLKIFRSQMPGQEMSNCGRREMAVHVLICPNKDRTCLLADTTDDLSEWLNQDYRTDLELA